MADVTNFFKATVKTLKHRGKILNGEKNSTLIFPSTKQKSDFELKAKEMVGSITKLRDFLLEHRKDYVNAGSHLTSESCKMTDAERDQIDSDAQDIIRKCKETITMFISQAATQKVHPQVKEHRNAVIELIDEYLKVVCKIYSEQRAVRVKRIVDRKRISKLEPDKKLKQRRLASQEVKGPQTSGEDAVKAGTSKENSHMKSNSKAAMEMSSTSIDDDDDDISAEDAQMFEMENQALFDEMNSLAREVSHIEGQVVEIARLQEIFTEKVLEQEKDIDRIADQMVGATENIKDGNEEIREAMKNSAGFRVWVLFFLLVCSLSLLFLDWYNG